MKVYRLARAAVLPLALAACTPAGQTQTGGMPAPSAGGMKTGAAITEADLKERLYAVAHDSMIGRATGTIGHIKVTDHIANEMKRVGLRPGGDNGTYFQSVPFAKRVVSNASVTVDGQALQLWDDYVPIHPNTPARSFDNVQVIFGGFLQDTTTMATAEQMNGKIVILLNRSQGPGARGTTPNTRLAGAAAIMTINSSNGMRVFLSLIHI